jgi:predicted TIM-barrel fold metal-dependent hydrolase
MIIDFRVVPPPREYIEFEGLREKVKGGYLKGYNNVYQEIDRVYEMTIDKIILGMKEANVDKAVLQAEWGYGDYRKINDAVYRMVQSYSDVFVAGFLCVNPVEDDYMVDVIEYEVKERGFKGVNIQPFSYRLYANDKRFYPVYEKCQELGIPITIHTSINFSVNRTIDYGRPVHLDEVACDFPDLIIVANHGGWPWVAEMVAVAWKHSNVYIEIGAVSPKYIAKRGSGWEPLLCYGNAFLQDKMLFATDNMLPWKRCVEEVKALPLKKTVKDKWLGGNAAKLLGLDK